jgi:LacI family transcriptional regulator
MSTNSLRSLAQATGFSLATVSRALRDDPEIQLATRLQIKEAAAKGGYVRNARVAEAMRQIRKPASKREYDALACFSWSDVPHKINNTSVALMQEAALASAKNLGWDVQCYNLNTPKIRTMGRMLYNRGISAGVILPLGFSLPELLLDVSRLAAVAIGYSVGHPALSRVGRASLDSMDIIFNQLRIRGYRRPGFVIAKEEILRTHRHPWAGFVTSQQELPVEDRIPMLAWNEPDNDAFYRWMDRHRPDVIIGGSRFSLVALQNASIDIPGEIGFVLLTRLPSYDGICGINPNYETLADRAVQLAIQMARQSQFGVPSIPFSLLVSGSWCDGGTLRLPKAGPSSL